MINTDNLDNNYNQENPINQNQTQTQSLNQDHGTYVQQGVPAEATPKAGTGVWQGTLGIIFALVSLLFLPPIFGIAGIILGSTSLARGQKILGIMTISLSVLFMIIGMALSFYLNVVNPDLLTGFLPSLLK